ncbi:uncharacterized protein [Epargyreus clarus]|uniref:uncharacterized protein n=1 Tax=Epargyreus clarus TaxID=520877 RepID=UPI003C2BEBB2
MYKTVRHGENSLQYTILPQTEEVLNNSGLKGKGRDYSPSIHIRRSRRRSTLKYVLLIVFGIIVALALSSVPLYVMNGALYARRNLQDHHEVNTASSLLPTGRDIIKSRKKELKITSPEILSPIPPSLEPSTTSTTSTTTVPTTVTSEKATTPPWTVPALKPWKSLVASTTVKPVPTENIEQIPLVGTPSGSVRLLDHYMSLKPFEKDVIIRPTVTPEPIGLRNMFKYYSHAYTIHSEKAVTTNGNNKLFDDVLITTKATTTRIAATTPLEASDESKMKDFKESLLSADTDDEFKEQFEEDEEFSLPPLKTDPVTAGSDSDEVTESKISDGGWYGARWPFVDTSSYFQWTGYSPRDNLLLPLLVAAISSALLVLLLALAVKRRKRYSTASSQIGKLTADLQADDNTNLLTAENPEETEE